VTKIHWTESPVGYVVQTTTGRYHSTSQSRAQAFVAALPGKVISFHLHTAEGGTMLLAVSS
jgi:hypothetical protein